MKLEELGWTADLQAAFGQFEAGQPGRVSAEHRGGYEVWTEDGQTRAVLAGALRHEGTSIAVGDWVVLEEGARISARLPRRSALTRKAAGRATEAQHVAANLDVVFVVTAVDGDLNPRRIERYVTAVWDGGALPAILVNKADLADDLEPALAALEEAAPGVDVHAISAASGDGLDALSPHLGAGTTVALVGSSGVGKTTLVNALTGLSLTTGGLGVDARGRHTTTARQMLRLPGGALLIDTPGMRELGLVDAEEGFGAAFADVEELGEACRFRDCAHFDEPGCAVLAAIEGGALSAERLDSYHKLQRELERHAVLLDGRKRAEERRQRRVFSKMVRRRMKEKGR